MRESTDHIETNRIRKGPSASDESYGMNGAFLFHYAGREQRVIASDGEGWEHVSVSCPDRCPTWGEMCFIKSKFWHEDETVIQYHPAKSNYVNMHPYCLHLWKPIGVTLPLPPSILVGFK
jgi:hypothetical protein